MLDLPFIFGEGLVLHMALALDREAERLDERRKQADNDANRDGDVGVAAVGGHEQAGGSGQRESGRWRPECWSSQAGGLSISGARGFEAQR